MISDTAMRYLQPPHTSPRTWQDLRRPHGGPSLAAANAAMHRSKQQQQQQQHQHQQQGQGSPAASLPAPCLLCFVVTVTPGSRPLLLTHDL
mmetsp:Transcript_27058/g.69743  ORF Transcript_27058/g.69743 Transcript_27058/m.69743 type:complete len:91 (-) Transcript_27058:273-545(-)